MLRIITMFAIVTTAISAYAGEWLQTVELKAAPEKDGEIEFTVRFTPSKTVQYSLIEFTSVYQQTFPFKDSLGRKRNKTIEPVKYSYKRRNIKLVDDLDSYVIFRTPINVAKLNDTYGAKTFVENAPVKVDRILMTAYTNDVQVWQGMLVPGKSVTVTDKAASGKTRKPGPPGDAAFGEIDLD